MLSPDRSHSEVPATVSAALTKIAASLVVGDHQVNPNHTQYLAAGYLADQAGHASRQQQSPATNNTINRVNTVIQTLAALRRGSFYATTITGLDAVIQTLSQHTAGHNYSVTVRDERGTRHEVVVRASDDHQAARRGLDGDYTYLIGQAATAIGPTEVVSVARLFLTGTPLQASGQQHATGDEEHGTVMWLAANGTEYATNWWSDPRDGDEPAILYDRTGLVAARAAVVEFHGELQR